MTVANIGNRFSMRCMQYFNSFVGSLFFIAESGSVFQLLASIIIYFYGENFLLFSCICFKLHFANNFYLLSVPLFGCFINVICILAVKRFLQQFSHLHEWRTTFMQCSYYSYFMRKKMKMAIRRIYSYGIEQNHERNEQTRFHCECVCGLCITIFIGNAVIK